jgi:hypothetical protein
MKGPPESESTDGVVKANAVPSKRCCSGRVEKGVDLSEELALSCAFVVGMLWSDACNQYSFGGGQPINGWFAPQHQALALWSWHGVEIHVGTNACKLCWPTELWLGAICFKVIEE